MRVYNLRDRGYPATAKKVDRSTPFGNPFPMGKWTRNDVCEMFAEWVEQPEQATLRDKAKRDLKGHDLLCWCAPQRCHAETWLRIANS